MSLTRRSAVRLACAAALVAGGVAAPVAAAGCARVRTGAGWTLADVPVTGQTVPVQGYVEPSRVMHPLFDGSSSMPPGGVPGRRFLTDGASLFRSADSGCTWQRVYTLDQTALAERVPDPVTAAAMADVQYGITTVETRAAPPGVLPQAGRDQVYLLIASGSTTALAQNFAKATPFFVAHSGDGGTTWRTDLMSAPLDGMTQPTPVLGDGTSSARLLVSPADPRTAYVHVASSDPRASGTGALYVTRDGGSTWAFATTQPMAVAFGGDPADPATLYRQNVHDIEVVTVGPAVRRRTLLTLPAGENARSIDATRPPGRPTRLLVMTSYVDPLGQATRYRFRRSLDAGRTWLVVNLPMLDHAAALPALTTAWLTATGDVVVVHVVSELAFPEKVRIQRWSAARRAWLPVRDGRPPLTAGANGLSILVIDAADTGQRTVSVYGREANSKATLPYVVGVLDLGP